MAATTDHTILDNPDRLTHHIREMLENGGGAANRAPEKLTSGERNSAVLLAVTLCPAGKGTRGGESCLILNKRSQKVRQPGDLCFPGGGLHYLDKTLSKLLNLPGSPLGRPFRQKVNRRRQQNVSRRTRLYLTTSLREAWEEMRLNPLRVEFLGTLPIQRLVMFERIIQPLVAWVRPGQRFRPNWEVDRIVYIPLKQLLDKENYGRYRLRIRNGAAAGSQGDMEFPCFLHRGRISRELLWGASFRITMDFLRIVFGFEPPQLRDLPVFKATLDEAYLNGSRLAGGSRKG